jgi:hypothetical protein
MMPFISSRDLPYILQIFWPIYSKQYCSLMCISFGFFLHIRYIFVSENFDWFDAHMIDARKAKKTQLVWAILLIVGFPLATLLPFVDALYFQHVSLTIQVPFEFTAGLLSTASILFGFTSLIIISKEWVERKVWAVLMPPLALIILSGVEISNLALGLENPVQALLIVSATFNANVVSTGLVIGYVIQRLTLQSKEKLDLEV